MKKNSCIKYYGGKGGMLNKIYEFFPQEYDTFLEPFCGSAVVSINQPQEKCNCIINDLNRNVYSLFKVLTNEILFNEFKNKCDLTYYNEDIRQECVNLLVDENLSVMDRAYSFFVVNRMSFNGIGAFSVNRCIRRNMSKSVSDFLSTVDGLYDLHQVLSKMVICNQDGIKLIEKHNSNNTFIYLDPPYHHSTRTSTRYDIDMDDDGHRLLLNTIVESKSKILLSGYDNDLYETILVKENGWNKHSFEVKTTSGNFKPKTKLETVWFNYNLN